MAELGFFVELVCCRLSLRSMHGQQSWGYLKWPLLGCAVSLIAGCGTIPSQPTIGMSHPSTARYPASARAELTHKMHAPEVATKPPKWELTIADDPAVESWVQRFSQEKQKSFQAQLDRARQFVVPAQEIFEQAGLPKDLVYVALVESGFCPTARSHASAVGMWQFISSTGKRFGLEQNQWVDERCHPFKSARAAADYLSFLYDTFGSWELALAAYNAGENGVQAALDQSGAKTFWELVQNGYLPSETRDYVPKVLAAVKIIRNPRHYGFQFEPQYYVPKHETVSVPGGVKLAWLETQTGIPESTLRNHNPELTKPLTPPNCSDYQLCVPVGTGETVRSALTERRLPDETAEKNTSATHTVKAGDTLTGLARKQGNSSTILAASNKIDTRQPLKAGQQRKVGQQFNTRQQLKAEQQLKVGQPIKLGQQSQTRQQLKAEQPLKVHVKGTTTAAATKRESTQQSPARTEGGKKTTLKVQNSSKQVCYPIRKGDTLSSIAERFQIPIDKLRASNELNRSQKLTPGNVLTISTVEQDSGSTRRRRSD